MSAGLIKHLKYKTEQDSNTAILLAQWEFDEKLVGKALENVSSYYPHFSSHNASHSQQILVNIERLLGDNINELSATDTWLLLESAYWHDIGMLFNTDEVQEVLKDSNFLDYVESLALDNSQDLHEFAKTFHDEGWKKALIKYDHPHTGIEKYRQMVAEWFRRGHPSNSQKVVEDPFKKLGINSPRTELLPNRIYRYLGQICLSHGIGFEQVMSDLPYRQTGMGTENCHPRYVACLLRLGDLFDIDDNRFCPVMAKQVANMPALSQHHADKHQAIREFQLDGESISITAECQTQESYIQSQNWFGWIKEEIQNQMAQWKNIVPSRNFGLLPTINKLEIVMDSPKVLLDNKPMKFSLDEKSAIELLQGKNLYDDETNIYRELIQNAVDATYMRAWIEHGKRTDNDLKITSESHPFEENFQKILAKYPLSIDFRKIEDEKDSDYAIWEFSITDKGTGISLNDLKHMQKIAGSSRNLEKQRLIKEMPVWMRPSGAFGIGLHSAFLLLEDERPEDNKIVLETKSIIDHQTYKIEMTSPISGNNGYCFIETLEDSFERDYGTRLSLRFCVSKVNELAYYNINNRFHRLFPDFQPLHLNNLKNESIKYTDFSVNRNADFLNIYNLIELLKNEVLLMTANDYKIAINSKVIDKRIDTVKSKKIWDSKYNLYVDFFDKPCKSLQDLLTLHLPTTQHRFKGQHVEVLKAFDTIIPANIDFYGFSAKESLNIDRNSWKNTFEQYLVDSHYFIELFRHLFKTYDGQIRESLNNPELIDLILEFLEVDNSGAWKSMKYMEEYYYSVSDDMKKDDFRYNKLLEKNQFIIEVFHLNVKSYYPRKYLTNAGQSTIRLEDMNYPHSKYFSLFKKDWYKTGGLIKNTNIVIEDGIKKTIEEYTKTGKDNNLLLYYLNSFLSQSNSPRLILTQSQVEEILPKEFSQLLCTSPIHISLGIKKGGLLLPFYAPNNNHSAEHIIISCYNLNKICNIVSLSLKKQGSSLTYKKVQSLYNELITFIDEKMEVIPEWGAARERGKDFVPKDMKELEEMFKS